MLGLTFLPVALILQRMPDVEKSFTHNCNDRRISDGEFPSRASVKRELSTRPTKNRVANFTPLRFCGYFDDNDSGFIASCILKLNMQIPVRFIASPTISMMPDGV